MSDSEFRLEFIGKLGEEFVERVRRGEHPNLREYTDRYPDYHAEIEELFPTLLELEDLAPAGSASLAGNGVGTARGALDLDQVGDYRILREIGRGGMGIVYEAEQVSLGRHVALKVLSRDLFKNPSHRLRFEREARAAAKLHHSNIVPVFGVGEDEEQSYYVMQYIQGRGLDVVVEELKRLSGQADIASSARPTGELRTGRRDVPAAAVAHSLMTGMFRPQGPWSDGDAGADPLDPTIAQVEEAPATQPQPEDGTPTVRLSDTVSLSGSSVILPGAVPGRSRQASTPYTYWQSVAQIGLQVAEALQYAHSQGILHRDIKPSNLLLDLRGTVWVTDFGLAKLDDDEGLTQTGDVLGTLRYMAPETFAGKTDARSEVYSLGLTLYELLVFRPVFAQTNRARLIEQVLHAQVEPLHTLNSEIPRDLQTIVHKAIDRDPQHRYQTAQELADDLHHFIHDEPIRARRISVLERLLRWSRHNRGLAVSLGSIAALLLIINIAGPLFAWRMARLNAQLETSKTDLTRSVDELSRTARELTVARNDAERKAAENLRLAEAAEAARSAGQITQKQLQSTVYAAHSNLALAAWNTNDVGRIRSLLDLMRPAPGKPDPRRWEWRYLWQLSHEYRLTLRTDAEEDRFIDVVFSPDGKTIASLESKGLIQLWNRQTGAFIRAMGIATQDRRADLRSGIHTVAFSPDGQSLAGPGPDDSLVLYAVDTGLPRLQFESTPGAVLKLALSPDGRTLVAAISTHVMRVWDARDGHLIHRKFGGHAGPVTAVAFSPDGRTLASAGFDHSVKLWRPEDPLQPRVELRGHTAEVRAVAFSPDGQRVCSAGQDQSVRVWDASSGAELAVIWGHTGGVTSLTYAPGSKHVITGSTDETVRIWDTTTSQQLRIFKGTDAVSAVAVSPDGRDIASAGDVTVRIWDATRPPHPRTLQSPSVLTYGGRVECLSFSADGRRLVSGHDDHALRVWELHSNSPPRILQGHARGIKCVAFSPDGHTIASGSMDSTVRLWDAETGELQRTFTGHTGELRSLIFSPDGQTIYSGGYDRIIQAWDPATGNIRFTLEGHSDVVHDLALSPDGLTLASASYDKTAILWDLPGRQPRLTLRGHTEELTAIAFSLDGQSIATASDDDTVRVWNASDGSLAGILKGHLEPVSGLAFNPDGRLASSGYDNTIRVWDPVSGQTVLILNQHTGRIRCIRFSPDGTILASASYDGTLKLWEAAPANVLNENP